MNTRLSPRVLLVTVALLAAIIGALMAQETIQAQEEAPSSIVVGTYDPQQAAEKTGLQQQMIEEMGSFQTQMQTAQEEGNQQEMLRIQTEAQEAQENVITEFEDKIEAALPNVAEQTGVDIIAVQVAYAAEGVETKDVTEELIAELNGDESKAPAEPEATQPQ